MRIVITGGTGLIGQALAANLAGDGYEVIVLSRSPEQAQSLPTGVRAVRWDARTASGWAALADGARAIVNLAGATISKRWTASYKQQIRSSRLSAGRAVVEAVEQAVVKPKVVIQSSGVGYYGPCGDESVAEDSAAGRDFLGQLAVEWEASTAAVETSGVRRAVIRSGAVLSTQGGAFPLLILPFRLFAGGPLGSGRQWLPWMHIADEVRAIRFLIENENAHGPFNLVAPETLTNREMSRLLGRVMKRPAIVPAPAFAIRLLLGEMSTVVLDGQRAVPHRLQELGFAFQFPEAEAAVRDLLTR